jgi:hypothetical protein
MAQQRNSPIALSRGDIEALRRVHVTDPLKWGVQVGTDFWINAAANGQGTASGNNLLTDGGWTTTSLTYVDGAAADFMSKDDVGTPGQFAQNAQNDLIKSPAIFGDYAHAHAAAVIMGMNSLPRFLIADVYATFSVASADEPTTALGFVEDGGSIVTAADSMACISSNGTSFVVQANGSENLSGAVAVVTTPAWFRIVLDKANASSYAYLNGTLIGSIAITADEFPVAFGAGSGGATNLIQLSQAHIFYAWKIPTDPRIF